MDPQNFGILIFKILWIHKILAHVPSKFCGSTKFWHTYLHNFVDPQNFGILTFTILWIHKKWKIAVNHKITVKYFMVGSVPGTLSVYKTNRPHICDKHHGNNQNSMRHRKNRYIKFHKKNNKTLIDSWLISLKIHMGLLVSVFQT